MLDPFDFEDLRPYTDQEVPAVIERLLQEPLLYEVMEWVYPGLDQADIQEMFEDVHTVDDFQQNISGPVFKVVTQMTTSGLSFTNMDVLDYGTPYLFLSNHRDIILDSALLNVSLMEKGHQTTQIAIGNNLLRNPLIYDLVRINKNFIVHRDINPREMLAYSQRLSASLEDPLYMTMTNGDEKRRAREEARLAVCERRERERVILGPQFEAHCRVRLDARKGNDRDLENFLRSHEVQIQIF